MAWIQAVDSSFDELTVDEAQRLKASGVDLFIQCLWTGSQQPAPRVINLRRAHNAGMQIAGYLSIAGSASGKLHAMSGRSGVPDDLWNELRFVAVDVELPSNTYPQVLDCLAEVKTYGDKMQVVYTNYNSWVNTLGNPQIIPDVWLWNAYWDGDPDVDFLRLPFGGWRIQDVIGEQWSGGTYVEGQYVDRNVFMGDVLNPPPTPPAITQDEARTALETLRQYVG